MTYADIDPRRDTGSTDNLDRILFAACAVIWLIALGTAVAATVALVDLGRTQQPSGDGSGTPWLLYTVIVISALVIIAAIPLLLRARRTALDGPAPAPARPRRVEDSRVAPAVPPRGIETPTGKLRMFGPPPDPAVRTPGYVSAVAPHRQEPGFPAAAVDQVYLRFALTVACALGVASAAIGAATYLMASDSDTLAWVSYGIAGLVTLASPVIPVYYLRELRGLLNTR